jgi:two-component system phosphate regulon sensor histidine kinase PhoR
MNKKIFRSIFFVAVAIFAACLSIIMGALYGYFSDQNLGEMKNEASYLSSVIEETGGSFLGDIDGNLSNRITWIAPDGRVLYDSTTDAAQMENHSGREEFREALTGGTGESLRYSTTMSQRTVYYAVRLEDGTVLRISRTQQTVLSLVMGIKWYAAGVLILAVVLSAFLAGKVSKTIVKPINSIDLESPDESSVYDELKPLVRRINYQNAQLQGQMVELKEEHENQDSMRREFTANVSHELKTPLTSISGYAEIIRDGVVKQEDIRRFSGKIYDEAQRLIILVEDIIKLSQLEGNNWSLEKTQVNLYELCQEVLSRLEPVAERRGIMLSLTGDRCSILGSKKVLDEMVFNICDNAIKYNKEKGIVNISIHNKKDKIELIVDDTGIGIPENEIGRVFERFYRVNKSHSKEVGGTGLGLAIVKHGAACHHASVSIKSKLGEGTTVKIEFNIM